MNMLKEHLHNPYEQKESVKMNEAFYILNSEGDLENTENHFKEFFKCQEENYNWKGYIG